MKAMLVLPLVCLFSGCDSSAVKQSTVSPTKAFVGCYRSDDESGYNVLRLRLKPDMTYKAVIWGDIGSWGRAAGNWRIEGNSAMLHATMEKEHMKGFTGPLAIRHGVLQGYPLDSSASMNAQHPEPWWVGWGPLKPTPCNAQFQDQALNPSG